MTANTSTPSLDARSASRTAQALLDAAQQRIASISPERLVAFVGLLALVVLLLAAIASVAQAQVRKGEDFQFVRQAPVAQEKALYSSRGGAEVQALLVSAPAN